MSLRAFRRALLQWFARGNRDLPWRRTRDPYRIWLSEIMLQQTRAAAAIPYYERFLARFPAVENLARASEAEVLALWSGLGYYGRARNLRLAAIEMVKLGEFPREYLSLRALPGVGPYTAAAVASIAFGLPHAVLDGNVMRVVARIENDAGDIASSIIQRRFQDVAQRWLAPREPGAWNQAMMELGATVCLPRGPLCLVCPLAQACRGREAGRERELPFKARKGPPQPAAESLVLIEQEGSVLMRRRPDGSRRMAGFWELPSPADVPGAVLGRELGSFRHMIVNQCWTVSVQSGKFDKTFTSGGIEWINRAMLEELPVTTITRKALALGSGKTRTANRG